MNDSLVYEIRAKKLGVLIQDARLAKHKTLEECARAVAVSVKEFEAYEMGEASPSLPQVELLGYFLDIPIDHFWGSKSLVEAEGSALRLDIPQLLSVRQAMIGAQLQQARTRAGFSLETAAVKSGVEIGELHSFEFGERPVPLPVLERLAVTYNCGLRDFFDQRGPVGVWAGRQKAIQDFTKLPQELQNFVSKPVNRPYLELAQRLSEMSVDRLRGVAEGLLEITL